MKTKKSNKIKMFNALTTVMENNKKIWIRVKEIEKSYKSFLEGTNKLNFLKDEHEKSLQYLIDKKAENRKNLISEIIPIANVIIAFAIENKLKNLIKKCSFTKQGLKKDKDLELVENSKIVWTEAKKLYNKSIATTENTKIKEKKNVINIHNFGLTAQMIDKLEIANVAFIESHLALKDAIVYKNKCKIKISAGIIKNKEILKSKLDLLMSIFKSTDSVFYKKYTEARQAEKKEKSKPEKKDKNETKPSVEEIKEEVSIVKSEKAPIIIPNKRPVSRTKVVRKTVSAPVVKTSEIKTETTKSSVDKPVVKKVTKRPSRSKSIRVTKAPSTENNTDESAKEI